MPIMSNTESQHQTLYYHNGAFMLWDGRRYRAMTSVEMRLWTAENFQQLSKRYLGPEVRTRASAAAITKIINRLKTEMILDDAADDGFKPEIAMDIPRWLRPETAARLDLSEMSESELDDLSVAIDAQRARGIGIRKRLPDPRNIVCCKNGLLDTSSSTLMPHTPSFYNTICTEIEYNRSAPQPNRWMRFLDGCLDKTDQQILQEWFGYCLVQDTRLQKVLAITGSNGSGKSTAMHVLQSLVGLESCCTMSFSMLETRFGLQAAIDKSLMIFPDVANNARRRSVSALLSIASEDHVHVDRRWLGSLAIQLKARIVLVSNEEISHSLAVGAAPVGAPQFVAQFAGSHPSRHHISDGLSQRLISIRFSRNVSDADLHANFQDELPGILNWSLDGLDRLRNNGHFTTQQVY
jgi:phage/plasmid-associated DNA primase